ncbi:MAG: hypothetical protein DI535_06125 [Citrobacter freundii]|nr:MAG: hypothetical protein DI535_06125 [Citrobacter freundii]
MALYKIVASGWALPVTAYATCYPGLGNKLVHLHATAFDGSLRINQKFISRQAECRSLRADM